MNNLYLFKCADFFLIRINSLPFDHFLRFLENEHSDQYIIEFYHNSPYFQEAVAIASPELHQALQTKTLQKLEKEKTKLCSSLLKYFIRMCARPTPFGLFSTVNWGNFEKKTQLDFNPHQIEKKVKPDMYWLNYFLDYLHDSAEKLHSIKVMSHPNLKVENNCFVLPKTLSSNEEKKIISIRKTEFTDLIIQTAKKPILYSELEKIIGKHFYEFDQQVVKDRLFTILKKGFLLSEYSLTKDIAIQFESSTNKLLNALPDKDKEAEILEILKLLRAYNNAKIGKGIAELKDLSNKLLSLKKVEYPLHVDAYTNQIFTLPQSVKNACEEAANLIYYFNKKPQNAHLNTYKNEFIEKYGLNRLVPLTELLDPYLGMGSPANSHQNKSENSKITEKLLSNLADKNEIIITEEIWEEIKKDTSFSKNCPLSIELYFEILAKSAQHVDKGDFSLLVNPNMATCQAGATFARFLYLWSKDKRDELRKLIKEEESLMPSIAFVEAQFIPEQPRIANISLHSEIRNIRLNLHYHEGENVIDFSDIYVGATLDYLYLFSKKLNKEIFVKLGCAVNPKLASPLLAFLLDITNFRFNSYSPYIGGVFDNYSYIPQIRYKNILLSPARWTFTYELIKASEKDDKQKIKKLLVDYFIEKKIPSQILLTVFDNKLLIDWKNDLLLDTLLQHFMKTKSIVFYEYLSTQNTKVCKNHGHQYASELVVPFVANKDALSIKTNALYPSTEQIPREKRIFYPGSKWVYLKIYCDTENEELLIKEIYNFFSQIELQSDAQKVFYIRYQDPKPHIRVRIHGNKEILNKIIFDHLSNWTAFLIDNSLASSVEIDPYEREIERYGGPKLIELIESLFHVDSNCCVNLIHYYSLNNQIPLTILAAFGIINLIKHFYGDWKEMIKLLTSSEKDSHLLSGFRTQIKEYSDLLKEIFFLNDSSSNRKQAAIEIQEILQRTHPILRTISESFEQYPDEIKKWSISKEHIIQSLIHMHCNRLLGVNSDQEKTARLLALTMLRKVIAKENSNKKAKSTVSV